MPLLHVIIVTERFPLRLTIVPTNDNGFSMSSNQFRDAISLDMGNNQLVGSEVVGTEDVYSISLLSFLSLGVVYLMQRLFTQF